MAIESSFHPITKKIDSGLNDIEDTQSYRPEVADNYQQIITELVISHENGVTVFGGGPLELKQDHIEVSWLTPVEVEDEDGFTNFHLIYLNCKPGDDLTDVAVEVNLAAETKVKLNDLNDPEVQRIKNHILRNDGKKRLIVRPSFTGSLAYPAMSTPVDIPSIEVFQQRVLKLKEGLNLNSLDLNQVNFQKIEEQKFELFGEYENFVLSEPEVIQAEGGQTYIYKVYTYEDPWRYYEIYTQQPMQEILTIAQKNAENGQPQGVTLRVDSGCDIGMLYHDGGCDCHLQLLGALEEIKGKPGLIIHCPTQDGRGYGMNTKMETEAMKQGVRTVRNTNNEARDTVTVAKDLFADSKYDIRTYDVIPKFLAELGFRRITAITDNRKKLEHLSSVPQLEVRRQTTASLDKISDPNLRQHVLAKQQSDLYIGQ